MNKTLKELKEYLHPTKEPEMPKEVEEFIKTEFGAKVKNYFMSELDYILKQGYNEAYEMVDEERKKVKALQKELEELRNG